MHRLPKICSFNIVIKVVSCGEDHSTFISQDGGHVYSMGSNNDGKLGVNEKTMKYSNVPCLVEGLKCVKNVACGLQHTLALTDGGEVYAWG